MGNERMKCPVCGTENIHDMLVEFVWETGVRDTTTLPKFLHYMAHPDDRHRMTYEPDGMPVKIIRTYCNKCITKQNGNVTNVCINTTRYGI